MGIPTESRGADGSSGYRVGRRGLRKWFGNVPHVSQLWWRVTTGDKRPSFGRTGQSVAIESSSLWEAFGKHSGAGVQGCLFMDWPSGNPRVHVDRVPQRTRRPITDSHELPWRTTSAHWGLALYDLSSSYFEGTRCPLARISYRRDGKTNCKSTMGCSPRCGLSGGRVGVRGQYGRLRDAAAAGAARAPRRDGGGPRDDRQNAIDKLRALEAVP